MILGLKGLAFECDALAHMIGIQNIIFNRVTKSEIKNAIKDADLNEKRAEMQNSKKSGTDYLMIRVIRNIYHLCPYQ